MKGVPSVLAGLAVAGVSFLLLIIVSGYAWAILLGLGIMVAGFTLLAAYQLRWVLAFGTEVDADQAAAYMSELLSEDGSPLEAKRREPAIDRKTRGKLKALFAGHGKRSYLYIGGETAYSALFDSNDQPFFKSFLRIDVDGEDVKIYCFGVADETLPATVEDHVRWDGVRWTEARAILGKDGKAPVMGEVDWYQGPELRFHLDADLGTWFTVLFSDGEGWSRAGDLEYRGPGVPWQPEGAPLRRWPPKIGLQPLGEPGTAPTVAEGAFI